MIFFALLANLWIYRIFLINFILGILIVASCIFLYKKSFRIFLLLFIPVLLIQIRTTEKVSLTAISNDDRREIDLRLRAYPPSFLRIGYWLEERKESISFWRLSNNLFENLDPNLYFFANNPRQRVGIKEFEKFPYLLFPVFVFGILRLVDKREKLFWMASFFLPIFVLTLVGNKNPLGPFSLFPFFVISISEGMEVFYAKTEKSKKAKILFLTILILVLIQMIAYEVS